jgi:hypothetical protein
MRFFWLFLIAHNYFFGGTGTGLALAGLTFAHAAFCVDPFFALAAACFFLTYFETSLEMGTVLIPSNCPSCFCSSSIRSFNSAACLNCDAVRLCMYFILAECHRLTGGGGIGRPLSGEG